MIDVAAGFWTSSQMVAYPKGCPSYEDEGRHETSQFSMQDGDCCGEASESGC
jgi:hypothetical protein